MRLSRVLPVVMLSVVIAARADAAPIKVSFASLIPGAAQDDPLAGLALAGFFIYDDPFGVQSCAPGCYFSSVDFPMLDFALNVDSYHFDLSNTVPGAYVTGPLGSQAWGPWATIAPAFLPPGVLEMELVTPGSTVGFLYRWGPGGDVKFFEVPFAITSVSSVPEPSTVLSSLAALGAFAMWRRRPFGGTKARAVARHES